MSDESSPLGRYAPDPTGAPLVEVRLLRLPIEILHAGREHHDGVLREFRRMALADEANTAAAPVQLVELMDVLGRRYASTREARDQEIEAALEQGLLEMDQVSIVPVTAAQAVKSLSHLLEETDRYCEEAMLVSLPRPPLLRQFSEWYFAQFIDQIEGREAQSWTGPLEWSDS